MSMLRRFACPLFLVSATLLGVAVPSTAKADGCHGGDDDRVRVDRLSFPITLSNGNSAQITGYYYHQGAPRDRILQVAVHGATHYHLYWDLPEINGVSYSYARHMAERGYDVLAIDQLGTGESSQPDGDFVTLDETARALHQVLTSLRSPHNPTRRRHNRIALVGHSNGSLTSIYTTGTYHDPDVLVTTAFMHPPHPIPFNPADILAVLTTPYIPPTTFSEAFWIATFYHVPKMDIDLVDYEYSHLGPGVQARAQFIDLFHYGLNAHLTRSTGVTVPVLVQNGDFDAGQPSAFMGPEPTYYPNAPSVTLNYLTEMGHHINGHINHLQSWTQIDAFLEQKLRRGHGHDDDDDHGHGHHGH
jgi:alpha-beta hydrolase superfamily lysophospholipase